MSKLNNRELARMRAQLDRLKLEVETMEWCITNNTLNGIVTPVSDRDLMQSKKNFDLKASSTTSPVSIASPIKSDFEKIKFKTCKRFSSFKS